MSSYLTRTWELHDVMLKAALAKGLVGGTRSHQAGRPRKLNKSFPSCLGRWWFHHVLQDFAGICLSWTCRDRAGVQVLPRAFLWVHILHPDLSRSGTLWAPQLTLFPLAPHRASLAASTNRQLFQGRRGCDPLAGLPGAPAQAVGLAGGRCLCLGVSAGDPCPAPQHTHGSVDSSVMQRAP